MGQDVNRMTPMKYDGQTNGASKREDPREYPKKLVIRAGNRVLAQPVTEIDYLASGANYVYVYSAGQVFRTRSTFKGIEQHLDPQKFGRVHRRTIVNFDRVKEFCALPRGDYKLTLTDGTQLRMSRRHRRQLDKIIALGLAAGKPPLKYRVKGKKNNEPMLPSSVTEHNPSTA